MKSTIDNIPIKIIIDSGCSHSSIGREVFSQLKAYKILQKTHSKVVLADKKEYRILKRIEVKLVMEGKEMQAKVNVIDMNCDNILFIGQNTLLEKGIDIKKLFLEAEEPTIKESHSIKANEKIAELYAFFNQTQTPKIICNFEGIKESKEKKSFRKFIEEEIFQILSTREPNKPVKSAPVKVVLKQGAKVWRSRTRAVLPKHESYAKSWLMELLDNKMIAPTNPIYSSAMNIVEDDVNKYRMTMDYRQLNENVEKKEIWLQPLEHLQIKLKNAKYFFRLDLTKAFWQIAIDEQSADYFAFTTPLGTFKPLRLPMGYINSVAELMNVLSNILREELEGNLILYVDDILGYSDSINGLEDLLRRVLTKLSDANFLINFEKSIFLTKKIKFCGRIVENGYISYDPEQTVAVTNLKKPELVSDLQTFYHSVSYFRSAIPNFARRAEEILRYIQKIGKIEKSNSKKRLKKHLIDWTEELNKCFEDMKKGLLESQMMRSPSDDEDIFLVTDASHTGFGSFISYTPKNEQHLHPIKRTHQPAGFYSGVFNDTQKNWSTTEKECFAIVASATHFRYLIATNKGFTILTDHENLKMILTSSAVADVKRIVAEKLSRWKLRLSALRFEIVHIKGESNIFADFLSRFQNDKTTSIELNDDKEYDDTHIYMIRLVNSTMSPDFKQVNINELRVFNDTNRPPMKYKIKEGLAYSEEGKIFVPNQNELRMRIIITAHSGFHRGIDATIQRIKQVFEWNKMREDVQKFISSCIHCKAAAPNDIIKRPFGVTITADAPRKVIAIDHWIPGNTKMKNKYKAVLTIKDIFSGFVTFYPCKDESANEALQHTIHWFGLFGMPDQLVSDEGSAFTSALFQDIMKKYKIKHQFSIPYLHFTNGAVERVHKDLNQFIRACISEYDLPKEDWYTLLPKAMITINSSISEKLGNRTPAEVFLSTKINSNKLFQIGGNQENENTNVEEKLISLKIQMEETLNQVKNYQKIIDKRPIEDIHELKVDDWVLKAKTPNQHTDKLDLVWIGPYKIKNFPSAHRVVIEDPRDGKTELIHPSRIKLLATKDAINSKTYEEYMSAKEATFYIEEFEKIEELKGNYRILVRWTSEENKTTKSWETITDIYEYSPEYCNKCVEKIKNNEQKNKIRNFLNEYNKVWRREGGVVIATSNNQDTVQNSTRT